MGSGGLGGGEAGACNSASIPLTRSKNHLGRKPTLSSPPATASKPSWSRRWILTPSQGERDTRQTCGAWLSAGVLVDSGLGDPGVVSLHPFCARDSSVRRVEMKCWPQCRQTWGSQAPGFPRTRRGSWMVLKNCVVVRRPAGVRKPTTISLKSIRKR